MVSAFDVSVVEMLRHTKKSCWHMASKRPKDGGESSFVRKSDVGLLTWEETEDLYSTGEP